MQNLTKCKNFKQKTSKHGSRQLRKLQNTLCSHQDCLSNLCTRTIFPVHPRIVQVTNKIPSNPTISQIMHHFSQWGYSTANLRCSLLLPESFPGFFGSHFCPVQSCRCVEFKRRFLLSSSTKLASPFKSSLAYNFMR